MERRAKLKAKLRRSEHVSHEGPINAAIHSAPMELAKYLANQGYEYFVPTGAAGPGSRLSLWLTLDFQTT